MAWDRNQMAARAARELKDGYYVNLGIGIPTLVANNIPAGMTVTLQSENGMLGIGPFPYPDEVDADLINAGKQTISELDSLVLFLLVGQLRDDPRRAYRLDRARRDGSQRRRRHRQLDDPGQDDQGHGRGDGPRRRGQADHRRDGAYQSKNGDPKFIPACTLPLTGKNKVDMIVTDLAVFERADHDTPFRLVETAPGVSAEEVRAKTTAHYVE